MLSMNLLRMLVLSAVVLPVPAFAVSQLSISSPGGNGVFLLEGQLEVVGGLHARIGYDPATLANPRVALGGMLNGVLTAVNAANPIQIGAVVSNGHGISASGVVATITFDRLGDSPGQITGLTADLVDVHQKKVAMAQPLIVNPNPTVTVDEETSGQSGNNVSNNTGTGSNGNLKADTVTTPSTSHPVVVGGTVTLPAGETSPKQDPPAPESTKVTEEPTVPVAETVPAEAPAPASKASAEPAFSPTPVESILERFRHFDGDKNIKSLVGLFSRERDVLFTQVPPIAIADGIARVTVTIPRVGGNKAPSFALRSASFSSVARTGDGGWEIVVTPEKGAVTASIAMLLNGSVQEIPLTVAPKTEVGLAKRGALSEADFLLFLQQRGIASTPKFDLNLDGKRDYVDDYIFTANYLVRMEEAKSRKTK